jgi:hypothetical protein
MPDNATNSGITTIAKRVVLVRRMGRSGMFFSSLTRSTYADNTNKTSIAVRLLAQKRALQISQRNA